MIKEDINNAFSRLVVGKIKATGANTAQRVSSCRNALSSKKA